MLPRALCDESAGLYFGKLTVVNAIQTLQSPSSSVYQVCHYGMYYVHLFRSMLASGRGFLRIIAFQSTRVYIYCHLLHVLSWELTKCHIAAFDSLMFLQNEYVLTINRSKTFSDVTAAWPISDRWSAQPATCHKLSPNRDNQNRPGLKILYAIFSLTIFYYIFYVFGETFAVSYVRNRPLRKM